MIEWVSSDIKISGPKHLIEDLLEEFQEKEMFLQILVPMPESIAYPTEGGEEYLRKIYGVDNFLDWSNKYWGTTWDISEVDIENFEYTVQDETATISGHIDTARTRPFQAFKTFMKYNPKIKIECFEKTA